LQEFEPWLKWLIFEAVLALIIRALVSRIAALEPFFEAIGLL
jgi:hypothetical protein